MNSYITNDVLGKLQRCFYMSFINMHQELIVHKKRNSYFSLLDIESEVDLQAKVIEWLSREACKGGTKAEQKYHLDGINAFLGTNFSPDEMMEIYSYLGNGCCHGKTIHFIKSGYDLSTLKEKW